MPITVKECFEADRDLLLFAGVVVEEVSRIHEEAARRRKDA